MKAILSFCHGYKVRLLAKETEKCIRVRVHPVIPGTPQLRDCLQETEQSTSLEKPYHWTNWRTESPKQKVKQKRMEPKVQSRQARVDKTECPPSHASTTSPRDRGRERSVALISARHPHHCLPASQVSLPPSSSPQLAAPPATEAQSRGHAGKAASPSPPPSSGPTKSMRWVDP